MNARTYYRSILRTFAAALTAAAISTTAAATTWFVSPCGQNGWAGVDVNCAGPAGPKQTIQAAINVANDGDNIIVMPGTYFEKINLNGKAVTLMSAGGPEVTTINGNNSGPVVTFNSGEESDTVIQGFRITSGSTTVDGGAMLIILSSPTIINCRLVTNGTTGNGGAMAVFAGAPTIEDCIISSNQAGAEPPAAGKGMGGGIYAISSTITMSNTFMQTCYTTRFGGLMALVNSNAIISDCSFYTSGSTFDFGSGGGIYLDGSTASIDGCSFDGVNVWSPDGEGGSILAVNDSEVTCTATAFFTSGGNEFGGAASIRDSQASFIGCEFDNLAAKRGGAIHVENGTLSAVLCGFVGCHTWTSQGGAIHAIDSTVNLGASTFIQNQANSTGGAVYLSGSQAELVGCTFSGNESYLFGGAIVAAQTNLNMQECTFANNAAQPDAKLNGSGGAVYIVNHGNVTHLENCTFTVNSAALGGGLYAGLSQTGAQIVVDSCLFEENFALDDGGAAYLSVGSSLSARVIDSQFIANNADDEGGALVSRGSGRLFIDGSTFQNNSAHSGGAINCTTHNFGQGELLISRSLFRWNVVPSTGSAIEIAADGNLHMMNCIVHNNSAGAGGGAIAETVEGFFQGRFRIVNSIIASNIGGGVYVLGATTESDIVNSIVWGNGTQFTNTQPTVRYSNVQGGAAGVGNINANPSFIGALGGNFRLNAASPCIDAGHNWALPSDAFDLNTNGDTMELWSVDFDGNPRITDNPAIANTGCSAFPAVVDMGAFETVGAPVPFPVNLGDLNGDGMVGVPDLLMLINAWGNCAGGCCIADLNLDGEIGVPDLLIMINNWG